MVSIERASHLIHIHKMYTLTYWLIMSLLDDLVMMLRKSTNMPVALIKLTSHSL